MSTHAERMARARIVLPPPQRNVRSHQQRMDAARGVKLSANAGRGLRSNMRERSDLRRRQDKLRDNATPVEVPDWV